MSVDPKRRGEKKRRDVHVSSESTVLRGDIKRRVE